MRWVTCSSADRSSTSPPGVSMLAVSGQRGNTLEGEEIRAVLAGIWPRRHLQQLPGLAMRLYPLGEVTVADVRCRARDFPVRGIDDHEPRPGGEQVRHVGFEDRILGQVVNDVEGNSQVRGEKAGPVAEAGAVIQEEALRRVTGEAALA